MHRADRLPALLSRFVYAVPIHEAAVVLKDQRRQLELRFRHAFADSAGSWLRPIRIALCLYKS